MSYINWDTCDYEDYGRQNIRDYWDRKIAAYVASKEVEFTEEDCVFLKSLGATV